MGSNSQHWDWERGMEILSLLAWGAAELYQMGQCKENVEEAVRKGIECAGRGDHRKALEYYEEALTISQEKGFTRHETNIYGQIGYSSFHVGDYERSINFMKKFLNDGGEDLNGVVNSILGSCYQHNGQYKEAIPYHEKSWKIASQLGNNENYGVAREICNLGFAYKGLGKHEMARRNFSESLRISKDSMYKDIEQQVHMGIGCIHKELGDYERAIGCFQQSLELAEQLVNRKGIALVYERLGGVNFAQNRYKRAIEYFEKCLDKARRIDDRVLIALAYKNMGRVHQKLNELQEAINCYQEYLKRADEKRDRSEIAEVNILHLGVCYVQCKEYEKAVECYLKGLELVKQLEDKEKEGNVHENLGDAYANLSKYNDAQKHYTKAQVIANLDAEGGKKLKGRVCLKLGDVFRVQEKISMAISCYNEALENAERSRDLESEVGALERLGNAFHSNGNYDSAIEYHEKSLDLAIKLNDKKREQRTRENLGDVCASCKKWSKANKWYNSSRALANELNNAEAVYNCERKMGNTYYENQDYDNAIFYHQRCLKIAEQKNEKAGILESSRVLGDSYRKVNQPEKSLQFYKYFIEMVGTQTSNLERATVYLKIGKLYAEIGDSDNAIDSCFKCLNLAVDSGDFKLKEEVLEILADEYYNRYQFDKAYKYYLEDLDIAGRDKRCQIYYKLGNTVSAQHRIVEAIQFYEKALELSQSLADPNVDLEADIREALAGALFSNTDYEDAIKHHSENLEFAKSLADEKRQQSEYENLANSYSAKEQWLLAIENYCHSGVVAKRLHDKEAVQRCEKLMKEQAFALECLCNDHILNGDYRKALDMQEKYVELARKIGDRVQEGNANCNIAEVHLARCQYEEAVRFTRKALGISDNDSGKARANDILGCAHAALGKFIEAERFLLEEISIVEILDDKSRIARAKGNIGVALLGKDDQREAAACFRKELKLAEEIGNKKEEGRANENFGRYYAAIGKCNEAIEYYQKFMRIAEEIGDKAGIGRAKGAIGTMLTEMGQYQKAVKYHEEERIITNELGNQVRKGQMLGNLGNAYKGLCDYENAIALQKTSLQIAEDNYVECDERRAYEALGNTYLASGQCRKALEYQNMALKLSQQLGHKAAEGRIHQSMAKSYYLSGQIEKALNSGKKALAIAEKVGDKAGEGRASGTIGNAYMEFGQNMQEARSKFREHLRIARDLCNKADEGDALASMAPFYIEIGQYSKALECCNSCLKIAENLQDKAREGRAYGNLGKFYIAVGRLEEAIESHQRHLKIATELDDKAEIGRANGNLGNAYSKIGQHQHAMKCHSKDKDIAEELGNEARNGRAQGNMGITYANMKQFEKAFNCHLEHLSIAEKLNDKSSLAKALLGLGEYHKNHDQFEKAIENFIRLLEISRPDLGSPELTAIAQEMLGQCYINSDPSKACSLFAKSIINFQDIRKSLREHDEFNVSMSNRFSHVHKLLLESLLNLKEVQTALVVSDCGKAQALRDLTWKKVQSCDDIPFDNFYKEDPMETIALDPSSSSLENLVIDSFYNIFNFRQADAIISYAFGSNGELNSWVISQGVFHKSYKIPHERSMRNFLHRHISCLKGNLNVRTAQSSLREDFKVLPDIELSESNPLFSMSDENENYEGENIAEIHHLRNTDFVNNSCSRKPSLSTKKSAQSAPYNVDLQDLYAALIQPIEEHLYGSKLLIVPEGPLFTLPFPALLDPSGTYLCEKYSLQFIPSLHVLNFCLSRQPAQLGPALFVGNPEIDMAEIDGQRIKLPPLPNAEQEAIECSKYFNAQPLLKHQATKEKVLREIGNASVVHIASHGYFKHAEVFLAPNDGAPDHPSSYLLTAEDILRCRLNARLVVLSCCDSGRGEISSEGVVGIARSFLGSGARAVLVALWQIDDAATMEIMIEFYDKMVNGCSVCSALRRAMVGMKKKYPPSAWSPFQVIGEDIVLTYEEIEEIRRLSVSSLKEDAVPSAQNVYGNDGKDTDSLDELIAMLSLEGLT